MSNQRRRAHDFTESLTSFREIISKKYSSQTMSRAASENRLDDIRDKQDEDDKHSHSRNDKSRGSIILAGSLASQQCISLSDSCNIAKKNHNIAYNNRQFLLRDTWSVSDETSYLSMKPDLNKCMNLFHNEHLKEYDSLEEQLNTKLSETTISENTNISHLSKNTIVGQRNFNKHVRSMSTDSLKNTISLNQELRRSKSYTTFDRILTRDTNYNIKADQFSFLSKIAMEMNHNEDIERTVPSLNELSKPSVLPSKKNDSYLSTKDERQDSINSEKSSKEELNSSELKTILHSLADQKPLKDAVQQRLLRRLSVNCYDSPKAFTEGLLTIIEESIINNNDSLQYPEVSLRRFNEELRKMCEVIEDETVPEWPQSPGMLISFCVKRKSQERKSNLSWKTFTAGTPDKGLCLTPVSPRCNIKSPKKICRRMSKNTSYAMKNLHDSTNTFENLEAYCEKLYPDEYETVSAREKIQLQSPLRKMNSIRHACESQMASLEDSFDIHEEIKKAGTYTSDQHNKTPETQLQHKLVSCEKYDGTDSKKVSDTFKQRTKRSKCHEMIEPDDFENTLMYEIAKKRQRCLDTVKIMMEIDANLESTDATEATKETYPNIVINESSPTTSDDKFMRVLLCVKKYQDYLEEHKPALNSLYRARSSSTPRTSRTPRDRKDVRTKKMSKENFGTCVRPVLLGKPTLQTLKLSPRRKSTSPSSAKHRITNKTAAKPRLFVTPGKTPVKSCKPKRTYFPNLLPELNKQDESNINPHAKKFYRQMGNYNHVISPVGMYIRGTESHLKKYLQPKTDKTLLTPKKKQTARLPSSKIKLRLSPKRPKDKMTETIIGDKNITDNFSPSKLHGKLPSHVHTIKEAENQKVRNRELLRTK